MRRIFLCLAGAVAVLALGPALASAATTWCVNDSSCTGDHTWGTISAAINHASSGDTIQIGPGTYMEQPNDPSGTPLTIVGAGPTKTLVQAPGSPSGQTTFTLADPGSTLSNVGVILPSGMSNTGLMLAGNAHDIAITEPSGNTGRTTGVLFSAAGTPVLSSSTIVLSTTDNNTYGVDAATPPRGTIQDSSVTAYTGITNVLKIARDRITANTGIAEGYLFSNVSATVDDALIVLLSAGSTGVSVDSNGTSSSTTTSVVARHLTVIGNGDPASNGFRATTLSTASHTATATITVSSTIIRNVAHALVEEASSSGAAMASTATVAADYSDYDASTQITSNAGTGATGSIGNGAHVVNVDPSFAASSSSASDPAAPTEFTLQTGSPVIDVGDPAAPAAGESTTDLLGNPRAVAGHAGGAAVTDMGAFEYQPHPPTVIAAVSAPLVLAGAPVTFTASGSDPDPGDSLTYTWAFDDGATASGASVAHAFTTVGNHTATVTAHDLDGLSASASAAVTAFVSIPPGVMPIPPVLASLGLNPSAFAAAPSGPSALAAAKLKKKKPGTVISYRDSEIARTTFTVQRPAAGRRKGRTCVKSTAKLNRKHAKRCTRYVNVGSFTHVDVAGMNRLRFTGRINGRKLSPGSYRLQVVATDASGRSKPVFSTFKIIR